MCTQVGSLLSRILIVQNDPDIRQALRDRLEADGYRVDTVGRGSDALRYLQHLSYAAVLLDIRLPDLDGLYVLKHIRGLDQQVPVIVATGFCTRETINATFKEGVLAYVLMPYTPAEMKVLLRQAIAIRALVAAADYARIGMNERARECQAVIDTSGEAIILTDQEGRILFWSSAAERLFAYCRQEMTRNSFGRLFPDRVHPPYSDYLRLAGIKKEGCSVTHMIELHGLRKDNQELPLELSLSSWNVRGAILYVTHIQSRTEEVTATEPRPSVYETAGLSLS